MAKSITHYRVFIASPGGLENERKAFKDVLTAQAESDGLSRGVVFTPIGWEIALRGIGRPQEKINEQVRECDYFVLLLWDRWGSPPDSDGKYSSGTEEEFHVALECHANPSKPMRDLVVLFKTVEPRQLSDPGSQLLAVQKFKADLERDRKHFYDVFDDEKSFAEKLRKYLARWTRDHEEISSSQVLPKKSFPPLVARPVDMTFLGLSEDLAGIKETKVVQKAIQYLREGEETEAEKLFAEAVAIGNDMHAFQAYGQYLISKKRLTDAQVVYKRMLKIANQADDDAWAGSALAGLGGVFRVRGNYMQAKSAFQQALRRKAEAWDHMGVIYVNIWLGDLAAQFQEWPHAQEAYQEAKNLMSDVNDDGLLADTCAKLAKAAFKAGDNKIGKLNFESAYTIYVANKQASKAKQVKQKLAAYLK